MSVAKFLESLFGCFGLVGKSRECKEPGMKQRAATPPFTWLNRQNQLTGRAGFRERLDSRHRAPRKLMIDGLYDSVQYCTTA